MILIQDDKTFLTRLNKTGVTVNRCQVVSTDAKEFELASASSQHQSINVLGLVNDKHAIDDTVDVALVQTHGILAATAAEWSNAGVPSGLLVAGMPYYVSTVGGQLTTTPPSGPSEFVRQVGIAISETELLIDRVGFERVESSDRKNAIINGNFDYWQRGTSVSTTTDRYPYNADRWIHSQDGTPGFIAFIRTAFPVGQTDVPHSPNFYFRAQCPVTAQSGGTYNRLSQKIEWVRTFAGQQVTLSFWARADSALTLTSNFDQYFGTGGSPSATVVGSSKNHSVTTTWQKFTHTVTLGSLSGKTIGTNNVDALILNIGFPINANFMLDIAQVQVELGPEATQYERRMLNDELDLCRRYYQKTQNAHQTPGAASNEGAITFRLSGLGSSAHIIRLPWHFATFMRGTPTVTWFSPATGASGQMRITGADVAATTVAGMSGHGGTAVEGESGTTTDVEVAVQGTADAEL